MSFLGGKLVFSIWKLKYISLSENPSKHLCPKKPLPSKLLLPISLYPRFFPGKTKSLRWNLKVHFLCKNNTTLNSVVFAASHIPITRTEQVLRIPPEKIKFMTQQSMQKHTQIFLVDTDASLNLYPSPKYFLFGNF